MLLTIPIQSYNRQFLIFLKAVKNNLMENSLFTRIIYSPLNIMFSGIYLHIPLHTTTSIKSIYSLLQDQGLELTSIESDILRSYVSSKTPVFTLEKQLKQRTVVGKNLIVLKISGVWETTDTYGLAYKFIFF